MSATRKLPPSPLKAGLTHAGFAAAAFVVVFGGIAGFVTMTGSDEHSGPKQVVGLFDQDIATPPALKDRLDDQEAVSLAFNGENQGPDTDGEPSLGVGDLGEGAAKTENTAPTEAPVQTVSADASVMGLPKAPLPGMTKRGTYGRLPIIASDGRAPRDVYSRPFSNPAGRPAISVIVGGLGLNARVTQAAIDELPADVTLSFVPYSRGLQTWVDRARAAGHEVMIELPMEPYDYPNNDTGPYTLLTTANASENRRRLEWLLSQAVGFYGVTNYQGAKFATDGRAISPVFNMLKDHGLGFVHDGGAPRSSFEFIAERTGLHFAEAARVIDSEPTASAIDEQLLHLEAIALQRGYAMGTGFAFPLTIDQLRDWTSTLESKGYVLAPASAQLKAKPLYAEMGDDASSYPSDTPDHSEGDHADDGTHG